MDLLLITGWIWPGERPTNYGWYHLMWLGIMVVMAIFLSAVFGRKHNDKVDNRVIFFFGCLLFAIELYKQIFLTVDAGRYQWYYFPFQFCSVPMFFAFIAPLVKKKAIQNAMYKFLAFFGFLAGFAVMLYPDNVFSTDYLTILLHTMIWHASMVIMGVYLIVAKRYCSRARDFFREVGPGAICFTIVVLLALGANFLGYRFYFGTEANVHGDSLNLMYISPYYSCPLPVLRDIQIQTPYIVFFLVYLLAFVLGISILWFGILGIRKLFGGKKKESAKVESSSTSESKKTVRVIRLVRKKKN